jgi:hypothetical protein
LDRRTNRPEGSGGASPTVVASRTGDDVAADGETGAHDGRPPDATVPDRPAAEGIPALPGDAAAAENASPLPADTIGTFTRPVSGAVAPDGDGPAAGDPAASARSDPPPAAPIGTASFRAEPAEPSAADARQAAPGTGPWPAAASEAAFRWQPGPRRPAAAAAAGAFPRAGAGPEGLTPPRAAAAGPAATATPPRAAPPRALKRSARQAHLTVARIEPWSVMKFSFVVSLVAFVVLFVAVSLLYAALDGLGVFQSLQHVVSNVTSSQNSPGYNAANWFSASRVLGYTALLGSLNIILITAMSTIGAVIYNLSSRLVGGIEVTLRETE